MDTDSILTRATHIFLITFFQYVQIHACSNQTMMADLQINTLNSPYIKGARKDTPCRWVIQAVNVDDGLYLQLMFASNSVVDCQRTYVDVQLGIKMLGRCTWCDLDFRLIEYPFPAVQVTAYNSMGKEFYFEVWYSTGPFKAPEKQIETSGKDNGEEIGIIVGGVSSCVLSIILGVFFFKKYSKIKNMYSLNQGSSHNLTSVSYVGTDQTVNIKLQDDPPDYWTVVSSPPDSVEIITDQSETERQSEQSGTDDVS